MVINEGEGIQHWIMKKKTRKEYDMRVRLILESEHNGANKMKIITLTIPVVINSSNIIKWKLDDIKRLDDKTREMLT